MMHTRHGGEGLAGRLAGERKAEGEGEGEGGMEREKHGRREREGKGEGEGDAPPHVAYASKNVLAFEEWAIQARKCPQGHYIASPVILWGHGSHEVVALCVNPSLGGPFFKCQHVC